MENFIKKFVVIKIYVKLKLYKYSTIILFAISYYIYYLSLEPCYKGEDLCGNNMKWIYKKVFQLLLSSEIISLLLVKILCYKSSNLHLIHLLFIFSLFYLYSNNYFFYNHGMYNLIFFFFFLLLNLFILFIFKAIKILIYIFRFNNKIYSKLIIICFLLLIYNFKSPNIDCDGWDYGLNNTSIDNNETIYGCKIKFPQYCQYKALSKYLDFTKILHINCSTNKFNSRKIILKHSKSPYITKNTRKFGFPPTNKGEIGCMDGLDNKLLTDYVLNNLFDVENNCNNFSKPEIIVDFSKNPTGELLIDLKYNESLYKERKNLEKKLKPYSKNVMIIFIDSVSRPHSLRQLNKTLSFFEKFMPFEGGFNKNNPEQKFHSFQFFKYYSFEGRTTGNLPPLFYGNTREAKNIVSITKYFKENGFVTNYCGDLCRRDNIRTMHNLTYSELYDYQMLLCDPNVVRYHKPIMKCLYEKVDVSYLFNYSEQFWRKYQNNRKFSSIILNVGHEGTMEILKYYDEIIYNYLYSLFNDNLLEDTSIFLLSDHGVGIHSIYYILEFFKLERLLPMLYIIINDRKNKTYDEQYSNINKNQQTFITAYDIYNTINHLLYGDNYSSIINLTNENPTPKSSLGISLFENINQKVRKPGLYESMEKDACL